MKKIIIIIFYFFALKVNTYAISASSYIVMDIEYNIDNNSVLKGSNINEQHLIASISKIMTCIIAIENGDLEKVVKVDDNILKTVGSSIYLEIGEKIKLKDLLYGMMMRSGNDAATMIAIDISGSMDKFSKMMNEYAEKLGMKNTYFYNSHGLEEKDGSGNKSSAYDMALLTSYAMKNKIFRDIFITKNYTAKSNKKTYSWQNKNKLLKYNYITGGKTGYTKKAKRTLVTTADIDNMHLVVVTLNDSNDWQDHLDLYNYVKQKYININILNKNSFNIARDVIYLNEKLYIKKNVNLTLKKNELDKLKIKYYLINNKSIINNRKIGTASIYLDNKLIYSEPIYLKQKKQNIKNKFKQLIEKVFSKIIY